MSTERVRYTSSESTWLSSSFNILRIEIMNDDEDDEEAPTGPTTVGDTALASPSPSAESTPVQVSPASA